MAPIPSEASRIFGNIRLLTSKWNASIFVVHPILALAVVFWVVLNLRQDWIIPPVARLAFALIYPLFAVFLIAQRAEAVKVELKRAGYTQRPTVRRIVYSGLSIVTFLTLAALSMFRFNSVASDSSAPFSLILLADCFVLGAVLSSFLGDVVWFTEKDN